jgi:hypothetical protein
MKYAKDDRDDVIEADVADETLIYHCAFCGADVRVRSKYGKKAPHFAVAHIDGHFANCPLRFGRFKDISTLDPGFLDKHSLEEILSHKAHTKSSTSPQESGRGPLAQRKYSINSVRALRNFLLSHSLATEYLEGVTVDDIAIDVRNSKAKVKCVLGGIRLITGETHQYDIPTQIIGVKIPTKDNCDIYVLLHFPSRDLLFDFTDRIFRRTKKNGFSGVGLSAYGELSYEGIHGEDNKDMPLYSMEIKDRIQVVLFA